MRDTRAVCFIFMYKIFFLESLRIKETETKEPLQSNLGVNITISPLKNEEEARNASVPPRVAATPGDARLKRQSSEYPTEVVLGDDLATMHTKSLYMFALVLKGLYSSARNKERFRASGLRPVIKMLKGKVYNVFFPPRSIVENLFKWKLDR